MATFKPIRKLNDTNDNDTSVYLVENNETHEKCVIKSILFLDNPIHRAIYDKEISALNKLRSSDNIVKLLDHDYGASKKTGIMKGLIYLEYVEGDTLQKTNYDITKMVDKFLIIRQIITALRCAHENGIIHRDVNPKNIMVTNDLDVKLIDFGICKVKGISQVGTTYQYATNRYAAPEVCYHSENATERSDIYSLGAVIYYMFTNAEPPIPVEFESAILKGRGIDIQLKDLLKKMVALNPEDRFENIIDLEIALAPLYSKYLSHGEKYLVKVPSEKLEFLRKKYLVNGQKKNAQLFQEDIPTNFCDAYLRYDAGNALYVFDGLNYSMNCVFKDNCYQVVSFKNLDVYYREKNRKIGIPINGQIVFHDAYNRVEIPHNSFELYNRITNHTEMLKSKRNIDNEYDNAFGFWKDFIAAMIEDAKNQVLKFNYESFLYKDSFYYFKLNDDSCFGDECITEETKFVYEKPRSRRDSRPIEIGTFYGYENDGSTMVIKTLNSPKKGNVIPPKGQYCVDYRKEISQYKRQERALDEFKREETNNNSNLKGIFVGLEEPSSFKTSSSTQFLNDQLDVTQQKAVTKILAAKDIALIQGPPGTGKTNVLVEVIRQVLKFNQKNPLVAQKILIVSQSHTAVDKILEELDPFVSSVNVIRIGFDEKFSDLAREKYSLDNRKKIWAQKIVVNSYDELRNVLDKSGIEESDFLEFSGSYEQAQIKNNTDSDLSLFQGTIDKFCLKYRLDVTNPIIMRLLVHHRWINQLEETQDIDEYFIKSATIVAGTCSGFASNPFINDIDFDYVFVDEAAKATFPEIMISMVKSKKVVLVGDHKQLPPVFDQGAIGRSDKKINMEMLKNSGFGKIFDMLPNSCKETLTTQYRMHPCIGDMISSTFYNNEIQNGIPSEERMIDLPVFKNLAMMWISTSMISSELRMEKRVLVADGNASYSNHIEAKIILEYIKKLDASMGNVTYSVGVITPYRAQLDLIQRRLKTLNLSNLTAEVNTVDAFQGSQKDIILYSTVRSGKEPQIGFLKEHSRLNVSFSRAKCLLIIVGDLDFLDNERIRENMFPKIIQHIKSESGFCEIINYRSDQR